MSRKIPLLVPVQLTSFVMLFLAFISVQAQFVHPGLSHKQSDLDRMYYAVQAQVDPYYESFTKLQAKSQASSSYTVQGDPSFTVVTEKAENSSALKSDVTAAYLNALMWACTRDSLHAEKCIEIFSAWSNLTCFTGGGTESLNTGRLIFTFVEAAEIIKSTYDGWSDEDIQKFQDMLVYPGYSNVSVPSEVSSTVGTFYWRMYQGDAGRHGNQDLFGWRGVMELGVFLDNEIMYDRGLRYLMGLPHREDDIPYQSGPPVTSDAPISSTDYCDVYSKLSYSSSVEDYGYNGVIEHYIWENGQCQESSRDQSHTILGVGQLASMAEIAWNQGDDIYSYLDNRILAGYEFTLRYNVSYKYPFADQTSPWEPTVETGEFIQKRDRSGRWFSKAMNPFTEGQFEEYTRGEFYGSSRPVYDLAYAHYGVRMEVDSADMKWLIRAREISIEETGQEEIGNGHDHIGFGGLTCYRPLGCAGDPVSGFNNGEPVFELHVLPGTVEAENFDHFTTGGESHVYHDTDDTNEGDVYRTDVGLDIEAHDEDGYVLNKLKAGEWVTYTCFVAEAGTYKLDINYSAISDGGAISLALNDTKVTDDIMMTSTGGASIYANQEITSELMLSKGLHPIRFYIGGDDDVLNLNSFTLSMISSNQGPSVAITSPTTNANLVEAESLVIDVEASDLEGSVTKVDFYCNDVWLGEDLEAPYSINWDMLPSGEFDLTAVATDNDGISSVSDAVVINVVADTNELVTYTLDPVADSYVNSGSVMTNYGTDVYMVTKATDMVSGRYFFVKFDLSQINGTIRTAYLKAYKRSGSSGVRSVYQVKGNDWEEDEINWGNQPEVLSKIEDASVSTFGLWTVSEYVGIQKGLDSTVTLCVRDAYSVGDGIDFSSRENGTDTPVLLVIASVDNSSSSVEFNTPKALAYEFSDDILHLDFGDERYSNVEIFSISGVRLMTETVAQDADEVNINCSNLDAGIFIVSVSGDAHAQSFKVVK